MLILHIILGSSKTFGESFSSSSRGLDKLKAYFPSLDASFVASVGLFTIKGNQHGVQQPQWFRSPLSARLLRLSATLQMSGELL
ncbi:hypothetical protein VTL71DRAFT_9345 [Oculimacula yallundae]|uniref:Uncharacterized protein n=1 Tax=Oculimacula yallundae TaxID=86028 RepID=A0ABR4BSS9_9HELO